VLGSVHAFSQAVHAADTHRLRFQVMTLHVEYTERSIQSGILFIFSLFYEYGNLEYVHIHVIYRVNQAEYVIRIRVAASQECVNIYSTRRVMTRPSYTS